MTEMDKLEAYLKEKGYEYERIDKSEGLKDIPLIDIHQIIVYKRGKRDWEAICHKGSYGYEQGLLEVMGSRVVRESDHDWVVGYLTAQDVIDRLEGRA